MQRLSLNGSWRVAKAEQRGAALPARVPGCVHTDLLAAGRIPDPYYRDNELAVQWVGETDWTYVREFDVPADFLRRERGLLRCEGLDTLATVFVNGREIGRADNMFRTWEFDARAALRAGRNRIEVRFASVVPYLKRRQDKRPLPDWGTLKGRAWVRKEPCNFGWDWGPTLITCGIWRDVRLVAFDTARLTGVRIRQQHAQGKVSLLVTPEVERVAAAGDAPELRAVVSVALDGREVAETTAPVSAAGGSAELTVANPRLWWPHGMGRQPLYTLNVTLRDGQGRTLDATSRRVGLRTLRLDRHPDEWGESFQFVVNGLPFFAKGANWIPADSFAPRVTRERYADLLASAAAANMNMLRVWGGGLYEDDAFYERCDELGLCIWQDFMFACSTYPAYDAGFMRNVKAEAEDNVRRLRHHACLALWCGNNELEQGLVGNEWNDRQMSWQDYGKLFDELLPEVVRALDPDRDYWPGSPHTPPPGDRQNANDPDRGDAHLWDVWHGRKPFEWYRTCTHRFNSEFGFQSFPEPAAVRGYTLPADRNVTARVMEHHQRSGIGNAVIMQYMLDWFRLPAAFDMTLWLSQIQQAMAIKYAVEHWRRNMPRGMGTLYWQINDCWPVASWSSLDSAGRWKALHYLARRFFAPLLVSAVEDAATGRVDVHVTSDRMAAAAGAVAWRLTDLGGKSLASGRQRVTAAPRANTPVATLELGRFIEKRTPRDLLLWIELFAGRERVSENLALFARPKHLELRPPRISAAVRPAGDGAFAVTLKSRTPALWAWVEIEGIEARYSDNFVHLPAGRPVAIIVTPARKTAPAAFRRALCVRSLVDTYAE